MSGVTWLFSDLWNYGTLYLAHGWISGRVFVVRQQDKPIESNRCGANDDGERIKNDNFITRIECNVSNNNNNFSFVPLNQRRARTYEHKTSFQLVTLCFVIVMIMVTLHLCPSQQYNPIALLPGDHQCWCCWSHSYNFVVFRSAINTSNVLWLLLDYFSHGTSVVLTAMPPVAIVISFVFYSCLTPCCDRSIECANIIKINIYSEKYWSFSRVLTG